MSDDDDGAVGYGRPPKARRFKKGESGNPRGRPPKLRPDPSLSAYERAATRMTTLTVQGRVMTMTMREAFAYALWAQANKHLPVAVREVRRRNKREERLVADQVQDQLIGNVTVPRPPEQQAILDAHRAKKSRLAKEAAAAERESDS